MLPSNGVSTTKLEIGKTLPAGHSLTINRQSKPTQEDIKETISRAHAFSSSLKSRLSSFLPSLAEANAVVEARIEKEGREAVDIEAVDEEERYIAMNVAMAELPEGSKFGEEDEEGPSEPNRPLIQCFDPDGEDSSDSDDESNSGEGKEEGLPTGSWITDPSVLAKHHKSILLALQQTSETSSEPTGGTEGED